MADTISHMFLKLTNKDIKGESKGDGHKDEIDIQSVNFGLSQAGSASFGGGAGTNAASFNDMSFGKIVDFSSPNLMATCAEGTAIKEAKLVIQKAGTDGPIDYLVYTMNDCIVSSYQVTTSGGESTDSFSINFAKITMQYTPQTEEGTKGTALPVTFNVKTGRPE